MLTRTSSSSTRSFSSDSALGAVLSQRVLLLNQNYEPLSVCRGRRAVVLMLLRKAEAIESYQLQARSVRFRMLLPSVLRLNYYVRVKRKDVPLTKRNVLKRDRGTCQYCGRKQLEMTADHVLPKALGGGDTWENLVCACSGCNARKSDLTTAQARMTLLRQPKKPHYFIFSMSAIGEVPEVWRQYLFQS